MAASKRRVYTSGYSGTTLEIHSIQKILGVASLDAQFEICGTRPVAFWFEGTQTAADYCSRFPNMQMGNGSSSGLRGLAYFRSPLICATNDASNF